LVLPVPLGGGSMTFGFAFAIGVAALSALGCGTASEDREGSDEAGEGGERDGSSGSSAQAGAGGRAGSATGTGSSGGSSSFAGTGGSGRAGSSGAVGSAASETGGAAGSEDVGNAPQPRAGGGGGEDADDPAVGQCTVPCSLELGPSDNLPGKSAVVLYDFQSNTATLTSDAQANAASQWVIGFSYESDPTRGYSAWTTGPWWFAFTDPLEYVEGTHSMRQDLEITSQMVNPTTNQIVRVVYSFGQESVSVHAVVVPACDAAESGACASPSDCSAVDAGTVRARAETCSLACNGGVDCSASCVAEAASLSLGCSTCYAEFVACATSSCPNVCPGSGNGCMICETEHDCHLGFMACSGMDYMPRGTLTWPPTLPR
jgi:hypothetical protein